METFVEHIVEPARLLLAWQAPDHMGNRRRWVVGSLDVRSSPWTFRYLSESEFKQANADASRDQITALGFEGYPAFAKTNQSVFESGVREAFMRRLPPRSRSDFSLYLRRFGFQTDEGLSDAALLAYTEAKLPSDGFSLVGELNEDLVVGDLMLDVAGSRYQPFGDVCPAKIGDELLLRKEPSNEHDPRAIEITWNGERLGYVNRIQAPAVGHWLDNRKVTAVVQRVNGRAGSPKVYVLLRVRPLDGKLAA